MVDSKLSENKDCSKLKEDDNENTRQIALARCDCLMNRYLRWKKKNHWKSDLSQSVALILAAITPVLLLLPWENVKMLGAATSAFGAIATGLLTINGWRDNYIRYGYIWHALQTEKYRYLTHATKEYSSDLDEEVATGNFARRIEQMVMADVTDWRDQMQQGEQQNGGP